MMAAINIGKAHLEHFQTRVKLPSIEKMSATAVNFV
jgi:hypothetical protein